MHVGIFGPTRSGKTTLAQALAVAYVRNGRANLVCDPLGVRWPSAAWQTTEAAELMAKAKGSRRCMLWIEEASISIARDRDLSWFFTTSGNPLAGGHVAHVIGQDGSSLLPGMRQQLATVFLFRCHPDFAEVWARQFCEPKIAKLAPTLSQFEFLIARAFHPLKVCKLAIPENGH